MKPRTLRTAERHILQAINELGDEAYGVPVRRRASELAGRDISIGFLYVTLGGLEREGYVRSHDVRGAFPERGGRWKRYWRPCFDLASVLAAKP